MGNALYCLGHPLECIASALPAWAWWAIGISLALILVGVFLRVWAFAKSVGGLPAAIGAMGILGTVFVAIVTMFRRDAADNVTELEDGPDVAPTPRPKPTRGPASQEPGKRTRFNWDTKKFERY